jgi:ABC-type molybdate transport system substrate-binding protein
MKRATNAFSATFGFMLVFGGWAGTHAQGEIIANFEAKTGNKVRVTYVHGMASRQTVAKGQTLDVSLVRAA